MHVHDHPANNIDHPDPGPRIQMAGDVVDSSWRFQNRQKAVSEMHEMKAKNPDWFKPPDTSAPSNVVPLIRPE